MKMLFGISPLTGRGQKSLNVQPKQFLLGNPLLYRQIQVKQRGEHK
jgi:hypothetical protein